MSVGVRVRVVFTGAVSLVLARARSCSCPINEAEPPSSLSSPSAANYKNNLFADLAFFLTLPFSDLNLKLLTHNMDLWRTCGVIRTVRLYIEDGVERCQNCNIIMNGGNSLLAP